MCLNLIIFYLMCHHHGRNFIMCQREPRGTVCTIHEIHARKRRFCSYCENHFRPYDINERRSYENYNKYLQFTGLNKPVDPSSIPHYALFDYTLIVPFESPARVESNECPRYFRHPVSFTGYPLGTTGTNNLRHYLDGMRAASQENWVYDKEKPLPPLPASSSLSITEAYIQALRRDDRG